MKFTQKLLASFALLLMLPGCGKSPTDNIAKGQTIRMNLHMEPQKLDPRKARGLNDINTIKIFMEGLVRPGMDGNTALALAEKYELSEDLTTYTFYLRNANWSTGDKITSYDFANTWKKSLQPSFPSDNAFQLYVIKNAKAIKLGKLPSSLLGIKTPDEKTLVIELERPVPYFLEMLHHPIFYPVHTKTDQACSNWAAEAKTYTSSGPFIMESWQHNSEIIAKKNPEYWDQKKVKLQGIELCMVDPDTGCKLFLSKDLNWEGSPFSSIPMDAMQSFAEKGMIRSKPILGTDWIRVNVEKGPLRSKKFRNALALSINRKELVDHVIRKNSYIATGIIPAIMNQSQTHFEDGNQKKARLLFEEVLEEQNLRVESFPPITLTYVARRSSEVICQAIQQQWMDTLGIRVKLQPLEMNVYFSAVSKSQYELALGNWIADYNDPITFLESFETKETGSNNTNWEDQTYMEKIQASMKTADPMERDTLLKECESILMDAMPVIPICNHSMQYIKDDSVKGVVLTNMGSIDFKYASVEEK